MSTSATIAIRRGNNLLLNRVNYDGYPDALLPALNFNAFHTFKAALDLVGGQEIREISSKGLVSRFEGGKDELLYPVIIPLQNEQFAEEYNYIYDEVIGEFYLDSVDDTVDIAMRTQGWGATSIRINQRVTGVEHYLNQQDPWDINEGLKQIQRCCSKDPANLLATSATIKDYFLAGCTNLSQEMINIVNNRLYKKGPPARTDTDKIQREIDDIYCLLDHLLAQKQRGSPTYLTNVVRAWYA